MFSVSRIAPTCDLHKSSEIPTEKPFFIRTRGEKNQTFTTASPSRDCNGIRTHQVRICATQWIPVSSSDICTLIVALFYWVLECGVNWE